VTTCECLSTEVHERSSIEHKVLGANVDLYVTLDYQDEVVGWLAMLVQSPPAVRVRQTDADNDVLSQQPTKHFLRHD